MNNRYPNDPNPQAAAMPEGKRMTVYVDDIHLSAMGRYGRMKMSHMQADTDEELHQMADKIGVARKWFQGDHYDIAMSKREEAISHGTVAVTMRTLGYMRLVRRMMKSDKFPDPETAKETYLKLREKEDV